MGPSSLSIGTIFALALCLAVPMAASSQEDTEWDVVADDGEPASENESPAASEPPQQEPEKSEILSGINLHGSFENQLTALWPKQYNGKQRLYVYDYTRLRVDLDANLPGGMKLRSDGVARVFVGERSFYMANMIPKRTVDRAVEMDPRWAYLLEEKYTLDNELYLDNAYLKIPVLAATVTVGKQPLSQGAGYVWNPTDVFNRKDLFDPTYEKEGIVALRLTVPVGNVASLEAVGASDDTFEKWSYGGRASLRLGPVSMSAAGYATTVSRTDLEGSLDSMEQAAMEGRNPKEGVLEFLGDRTMVGGDVVVDISGVRLWAEGAYNFIEDKEGAPTNWWELVGGAEYFFPFETHVMVEYLHYDAGPSQHSGDYGLNAWTWVMNSQVLMLGQDFLFESIDHPVADFWTVTLSSFQSISDGSASLMGDITWEFHQDAQLNLLLVGNIGDKEDFFSSAVGQGWLRCKVFF